MIHQITQDKASLWNSHLKFILVYEELSIERLSLNGEILMDWKRSLPLFLDFSVIDTHTDSHRYMYSNVFQHAIREGGERQRASFLNHSSLTVNQPVLFAVKNHVQTKTCRNRVFTSCLLLSEKKNRNEVVLVEPDRDTRPECVKTDSMLWTLSSS